MIALTVNYYTGLLLRSGYQDLSFTVISVIFCNIRITNKGQLPAVVSAEYDG